MKKQRRNCQGKKQRALIETENFTKVGKSAVSNVEEAQRLNNRMSLLLKTSLATQETIANWRLWNSNYWEFRSSYEMRNEGIELFNYSMKILAMKGKKDH